MNKHFVLIFSFFFILSCDINTFVLCSKKHYNIKSEFNINITKIKTNHNFYFVNDSLLFSSDSFYYKNLELKLNDNIKKNANSNIITLTRGQSIYQIGYDYSQMNKFLKNICN